MIIARASVATYLVLAGCYHPPLPAATEDVSSANAHTVDASTKAGGAAPELEPGAPEPVAPKYDLAADVTRRVALARQQLGQQATVMVDAELFVLAGAAGWGRAALGESIQLVRSALVALYNGRFTTKPSQAITIYLFPSSGPYERFCRTSSGNACLSIFGFYDPLERRIVMNAGLGLGTLTHELVHPLLETDFPGAPTWLNEGIASLFEAPVLPRPGEIHGRKNWRLPRLLAGLATRSERDEARLDHLFGMSDDTFRNEREKLHYATARYACQWLDEHQMLWLFYRRWRDHATEDPTGERSFEAIVGKPPRDVTDAWVGWVRAL
jgi:hypothetical protein